ncbi:MAG: phosphonate C-P lyase system protein PhnH [Alphaproteobacteria bacterium]
MSAGHALSAGFQEPVSDSARVFRTVLDVMARPGRVSRLPTVPDAPGGLNGGAAAVALTLLDADTPVWIDPALLDEGVSMFLAFHTGAPVVERAEMASFAFMPGKTCGRTLRSLRVGTAEYPDRSATAVILVEGFQGELCAELSGPGVDGTADLAPAGLDSAAWDALADNARLFPLGFDTIFVSDSSVASLPRSTRILMKG